MDDSDEDGITEILDFHQGLTGPQGNRSTRHSIHVGMTSGVSHVITVTMTSSNEKFFPVTGPLCGVFTGTGEFPPQRPVTRSFEVFFYLQQWLSKRLRRWRFETPSRSLWRHCAISHAWHCVSNHKDIDGLPNSLLWMTTIPASKRVSDRDTCVTRVPWCM